MKYVQNNLAEKENLIAEAHITRLLLIPSTILALSLFLISASIGNRHLIAFAIAASATVLVWKWLFLCTIELVITDRRVIGKTGLVRLNLMDCPLDKVDTIETKNSIPGRLFGYGDMTISTASAKYQYKNISNVNQFKRAMLDAVDIYKREQLLR